MSNEIEVKQSLSQDMVSSYALQPNENNQLGSKPGTSFEVFRNNTTAVEVIVKEAPKKSVKRAERVTHADHKTKNLQEDVDVLKRELNKADMSIESMRTGFRRLILEMKKQLDNSNQRELDINRKNLVLQLKNEKLTTLLESKTGLVLKLKNELQNMKHTLKFVLKKVYTTQTLPENVSYSTDAEYDEFEDSLKRGIRVKFANLFDSIGTGSSSLWKDT